MLKRVTGIGGIFFKSEDPEKLRAWYGEHLGFDITQWGSTFKWIDPDKQDANHLARTEWSPFTKDTSYFAPSEKSFMFNYRVENINELLKVLQEEGVTIVGETEEFPYGNLHG